MAFIPCTDFIVEEVPIVPKRIKRTNPDSLANRYANFMFHMDLSPEQKDEAGAGIGAWSLWDVPTSHVSQIDDDRGEDLITFSIMDRVYWFDWRRYVDEWYWNAFAPIDRLVRFGPIPSNENASIPTGGYDLSKLKRFREFEFSLADGPTGAAQAEWRVTVAEWNREQRTERSGTRKTASRMRIHITTKGSLGFVVTLEHHANEPVRIEHWRAAWDVVGARIASALIV